MSESAAPQVFMKYRKPKDVPAVSVGRDTIYGNPFILVTDGTRDEVCDKFEAYLFAPEQAWLLEKVKTELKGKNLMCYCKPQRCHADTLLRVANEP